MNLPASSHNSMPFFRPAAASIIAGCLAIFAGLTGCTTTPKSSSSAGQTQNVFNWSRILPGDLRRVACLPVTSEAQTQEDTEGRDALEPILRAELIKAKRFEVMAISPEALEKRTGQTCWRQDAKLPGDLFDWLKASTGADAVMFCHLSVFHAYPPLTIGLKMRLVDLRTRNTLWAVDEVFDAQQLPSRETSPWVEWCGLDFLHSNSTAWRLQNSPRQFGQYAAAKILSTLPEP